MNDDILFFDSIKEHRGTYFVDYQPPISKNKFATLSLVFLDMVEASQVAQLMEVEVRQWLLRYPVPIMVSAADGGDQLIRIDPDDIQNWLFAWLDSDNISLCWNMDQFSAYLEKHPNNVSWKKIYHDVPFRTKQQIRSKSDAFNRVRRRQVITLKTISFAWLFVIPSGIAIYVFLAPIWVGLAALLYSIWKAWRSVENIWGYNSRSARENEEAERQRKMRHYF